MERRAVARCIGTAITTAGLVFTAWSTQANASDRDLYHGIDVSMLRSDAGVVQGPAGSVNIDPNLFTPRVESKGGTKAGKDNVTKGAGPDSDTDGTEAGAAGTNAVNNGATNATAATAATNSGTASASKEAENTTAAGAQAGTNTGAATVATTPAATNAASNAIANAMANAAAGAAVGGAQTTNASSQAVAGFQGGPAMTGSQTTTVGTVNGTQSTGVVAGVQSLPSTSSVPAADLAGAGLALIATGGALVIKRRRT